MTHYIVILTQSCHGKHPSSILGVSSSKGCVPFAVWLRRKRRLGIPKNKCVFVMFKIRIWWVIKDITWKKQNRQRCVWYRRDLYLRRISSFYISPSLLSLVLMSKQRRGWSNTCPVLPCRPRQYSTLSTQEVFIWTVAPLKAFQTKIQFRHPTTQDIVLKMCQLECRLWVRSQTKLNPLYTKAVSAWSNKKGLHWFILQLLKDWVIKTNINLQRSIFLLTLNQIEFTQFSFINTVQTDNNRHFNLFIM